METNKQGLIIALILFLVSGLVIFFYTNDSGKSGSTSPMDNSKVVLPIPTPGPDEKKIPDGQYATWFDMAKAYYRAYPENKGLDYLVTGLEMFDATGLQSYSLIFRDIITLGWKGHGNPYINEYLQKNAMAFDAARSAAEYTPLVEMPPPDKKLRPHLDYYSYNMFIKSMLIDARKKEADGDIDGATKQLVQTAKFASIWCSSPRHSSMDHAYGTDGINLVLQALPGFLRNTTLGLEQYKILDSGFARIDKQYIPVKDTFQNRVEMNIEIVTAVAKDPSLVQSLGNAIPANVKSHLNVWTQDTAEYARQAILCWTDKYSELRKPYRENPWQQLDSTLTVITQKYPLFSEETIHPEVADIVKDMGLITRLRLLQAYFLLKENRKDEAADIMDPFTGKPIIITDQYIYSLGPDLIDQFGKVNYSGIRNNTCPEGDIVLAR